MSQATHLSFMLYVIVGQDTIKLLQQEMPDSIGPKVLCSNACMNVV